MTKFLLLFSCLMLFSFAGNAQVYQGKRDYAKIERIDNIETFLSSFTKKQMSANQSLSQMKSQNKQLEQKLNRMTSTVQRLERELRQMKLQSLKPQKKSAANSRSRSTSQPNGVNKDKDDPDRVLLLKDLNELRLQLQLEKQESQKVIEELRSSIKVLQTLLIKNEQEKGRLKTSP